MPPISSVIFDAYQSASLHTATAPLPEPGPTQVAGRTLYSVVSSGTELGLYQGQHPTAGFPTAPGYAAVFQVESVGPDVPMLEPGDIAFCMGPHHSYQVCGSRDAVRVPDGVSAQEAGFARFACVVMSALVTTTARPPDPVMVTGLGVVGLMAAQVFQTAGYEVIAVDPDAQRREAAALLGVTKVLAEAPLEDPRYAGNVALVLECAGHEGAALAGVKMVRKRGEVVLVGVPWAKRTDLTAHELNDAIFHRYAVLRSGWEWEVPMHPSDFRTGSMHTNLATGLRWLLEGRLRVDGLYQTMSPADCQQVYQGLLGHTLDRPAVVYDWSMT